MILIADSGSSKCDWAYCDDNGKKLEIIKTIGLNPYFLSSNQILEKLEESSGLRRISKIVKRVFFYGAGCSEDSLKDILRRSLLKFFSESKIVIDHDLLGVCRSVYNGKTNINCIIGTGSIACLYNGGNITPSIPSLGYILGDEGSGNYFGKQILSLYFSNQLPEELKQKFKKKYSISYLDLVEKVYSNNNRVNSFLSSFFPFFIENINHPVILQILKNGINDFLRIHVFSIANYNDYKINFFGSVSYLLKDLIEEILKLNDCKCGVFEKEPIFKLIDYHCAEESKK